MIRFETESGSTYELDEGASRIRRLQGKRPPRSRQGADGEWRTFLAISEVEAGRRVLISWHPDTTPLLDGSPEDASPSTITSRVVRYEVTA